MKISKIVILILLLTVIFQVNIAEAEEASTFEETQNALGFSGGFGGSGIAYRHYFSSKNGIQLTGSIYGYGSDINFNGGVVYRRVINQREKTRLLISSGFSFNRSNESLGSVLELEVNPEWLDNISSSVAAGYQMTQYEKLQIGPTMSVSLFYNF